MIKHGNYIVLFLSLMVLFCRCGEQEDYYVIDGMKPKYVSMEMLENFEQMPPQPIENSGKSMLYKQYLFLSELNKGIHIIDLSDTLNPEKIYFLKIPANKDMSMQNDILYADNGPYLLVLNVSDINHITVVQRIKDIFQPSEYEPMGYRGYFECADYNQQWLIGWEKTRIVNPRCKK